MRFDVHKYLREHPEVNERRKESIRRALGGPDSKHFNLGEWRKQNIGREWRSTAKSTVRPTVVDIAWIAGFLEGEGCFTTNKHRTSPATIVTATQKQREPLERLQKFLGGNIHRTKTGLHDWRCGGVRARGVMLTVFTFMSPRRKARIKQLLSGWTA